MWFVLTFIALCLLFNAVLLRGTDLSAYDSPKPEVFGVDTPVSAAANDALASLQAMTGEIQSGPANSRIARLRAAMDAMGDEVEFDGEYRPVNDAGLRGEWVLAPGADPSRRLLYIHGGAYMAGSPQSHRAITTEYSKRLGLAVFSLDYRLMPEHRRQAGIDDCRAAYRWLLDNGPAGASPADVIFVSGDSAGGNLSLSLSCWIRDEGLRAPNGVVALSPATDSTFASPSMKNNVASDPMLGPMFGKLSKIPLFLLRLSAWFSNRMLPKSAPISPVYADLSDLPPTLVHASAQEMLVDDAIRFVNRARSFGSPVRLQLWSNMLHVWHIFVQRGVPESEHAFDEIEQFMRAQRAVITSEAA